MTWKLSELITYGATVLLVFFGAAVHATNHLRIARVEHKPFTMVDWMILIPTSAFSGLVFGLLARLMSDNDIHLMLACSIGSFLGLAGLNKIADIVLTILTKGMNKPDE